MISQTKRRRQWTNAPTLLAMLMAMRIRRYDAKRIAQYSRSRATLDTTGRWDQASIRPVREDQNLRETWMNPEREWHVNETEGKTRILF